MITIRVNAQSYRLPPKTFYKKAIITTNDFSKLAVKQLSIGDSLMFYQMAGENKEIAFRSINHVQVHDGNYGFGGFIVGAAVGFIYSYSVSSFEGIGEDEWAKVLKVIIGTGILGTIFGLVSRREQSYFIYPK